MWRAGLLTTAGLIVTLAAGCSGGSAAPSVGATASATVTDCGTAYTAAHVAVQIEVTEGAVSCAVALRVEADYARKLSAGKAPGNGGGGPVPVDGWICQGYPTPQVLQTGRASVCRRGGAAVAAILPTPAASSTP
jgi:hypothetical protein